jgi:hypothetical protein
MRSHHDAHGTVRTGLPGREKEGANRGSEGVGARERSISPGRRRGRERKERQRGGRQRRALLCSISSASFLLELEGREIDTKAGD